MLSFVSRCVVVAGLTLASMCPALAQDQPQTVNAAAAVVPPFVMQQDGKLTGFSIDLWNEIAAKLTLTTNYGQVLDMEALADALRSNKADVVVTPIYYTTERDREFDFTYPILEAGLQVMVRDMGAGPTSAPLHDVLALLFSRSALIWLGVAGLIIIVPAHIVWLLDRGHEEGISPGKAYWPNILHGLSFATTALVSQVQQLPHQWLARIVALLWMFAGVVFIALYTAQLTATLTVEQIHGTINGPGDLPGKRVATIAHSVAAAYLKSINAQTQEFGTFEDMYQALLDHKVDAVLMPSPPLRYFAAHEGSGLVKLVGPEFHRGNVGFVFRLGDPLRRKASSALLALREDGTYDRLYEKWFGSETQ